MKVQGLFYRILLLAGALIALGGLLYFFLSKPAPFTGFDLGPVIGRGLVPSLSPTSPSSSTLSPSRPIIAIVIDDNGYNLSLSRSFTNLPYPLTISVLPSLKYSRDVALEAEKEGKEVILHCPMESFQGNDWLGPGAIWINMSEEEIRSQIEADLYDVPGAKGMNNHMGTKAIGDERVMRAVLSYLKDRGLYFLDSAVSSSSVSLKVGKEIGAKVRMCDLALDNVPETKAIKERLDELEEIAAKENIAIGIGHVSTPHLAVLIEEKAQHWKEKGYSLVFISEIFDYFYP